MSGINSSITLTDNFTPVVNAMNQSINTLINSMNILQTVGNSLNMNQSSQNMTNNMNAIQQQIQNLQNSLNNINNPNIDTDAITQQINALQQQLNNLNPPQIDTTEFINQINQIENRLNSVNGPTIDVTQAINQLNELNNRLNNLDTHAPDLDLTAMLNQVNQLQNALQNINDPNIDTTQIQQQIQQIIQHINQIDHDIQDIPDPDIDTDSARRGLDDMTESQRRFNNMVEKAKSPFDSLTKMIKGAVGAYLGLKGVTSVINLSDQIATTNAKLDMMNDGLQTTDELFEMIYSSAQASRSNFQDMADVVARFGNNAKDAFSSSQEVVAFTELIQKQMTIAGAGSQEASNAILQLSQALGSGVLRGDELNSIFEQAPNLIQTIADYMEVPIGEIRQLASEGQITADIVKNAMFASADDINAKFEQMPLTFSQMGTKIKNSALMTFKPILQNINEIVNSTGVLNFVDNIIKGLGSLASLAVSVFSDVQNAILKITQNSNFQEFIENIKNGLITIKNLVQVAVSYIMAIVPPMLDTILGWINPIISQIKTWVGELTDFIINNSYQIMQVIGMITLVLMGVVAVIAIVKGAMLAYSVVMGIVTAVQTAWTIATTIATVAQTLFNSALLACPITWIILMIIAVIAAIILVVKAIASVMEAGTSMFGVISGVVMALIQIFKNFGYLILNIINGIWNAFKTIVDNIKTAFGNAILNIKGHFYDLLATALTVIAKIANGLNKLPFVEIDVGGLTSSANEWANKAKEAYAETGDYSSVSEAFQSGMNTYSYGSVSDAYNTGYEWGANVQDAITDKINSFANDMQALKDGALGASAGDYQSVDMEGVLGSLGNIDSNTAGIAGNTKKINDSLNKTSDESLKLLRQLTNKDVIRSLTSSDITLHVTNTITTNGSDVDTDGIVYNITNKLKSALVTTVAEGIYES